MRKLIVSALLAGFILGFASCRIVNGNRNVISETRDLESFSKIRLSGIGNLHLTQGPATGLQITGESNIINRIRTYVDGDALVIKTEDGINIRTHEPVNMYVSTPDIEKISVSGAGDVYGENKWSLNDALELHTSGAGKIKAALNGPAVDISVSGAGDVILSGETKDVKADVSGAGKIKAEELKSENADVEVSGAGSIYVYASVNLKAHVSGAGNVSYWGNPAQVEQHKSGAGSIKKR